MELQFPAEVRGNISLVRCGSSTWRVISLSAPCKRIGKMPMLLDDLLRVLISRRPANFEWRKESIYASYYTSSLDCTNAVKPVRYPRDPECFNLRSNARLVEILPLLLCFDDVHLVAVRIFKMGSLDLFIVNNRAHKLHTFCLHVGNRLLDRF